MTNPEPLETGAPTATAAFLRDLAAARAGQRAPVEAPQASEPAPAPESAPEPVAEAPEPVPVDVPLADKLRAMSPGVTTFGPDGYLFGRRDGPPLGEPPEQAYRTVADGAVFATPEARLIASGWQPDVPELVELIAKRETLRLAVQRLGRGAITDPTSVEAAIRRADYGALHHDLDALARGLWLAANLGNVNSDVSAWNSALELAFRQCLYANQARLRHSLIGREGADADYMRRFLTMTDTWTSKPDSLSPNEYILY